MESVEENLKNINLEYFAKRQSMRLNPLRLFVLQQNSYETFKKARVRSGVREGQFKVTPLTEDARLLEPLLLSDEHAILISPVAAG